MIVAIGSDLVELARIERAIRTRGERFEARLFTAAERTYCRRRPNPVPSFAARFAAKEAVMKCLGTGWGSGVRFRDIEVVGEPGAAPGISLHGAARSRAERLGINSILLSLSHTDGHALAMAVAV